MTIIQPLQTQLVHRTCQYHTTGLNMTCMDCLVISGYILPPAETYLPWPMQVPTFPSAANSTPGPNNMYAFHEETYMYKMHYALLEMDQQAGFVPDGLFLDLG
ncbi:hypothetical protein FRC07_000913, partial [Ceratobasidium sp. 392]